MPTTVKCEIDGFKLKEDKMRVVWSGVTLSSPMFSDDRNSLAAQRTHNMGDMYDEFS